MPTPRYRRIYLVAGLAMLAAVLAIAAGMAPGEPSKRPALTPTQADVRYGNHPRNLLDFYRAESEGPTPVLIFFHGGGFVAGDKRGAASSKLTKACVESGISVVAANYRFIKGPDSEPFPGPMNDGARVVQFVRSKAGAWNVDPQRIALTGGSAGACMSMWIAMHDDLADPKSDDPLARLSTRVSCVVAYGGQSSLDPVWILENIGGNPTIHPSVAPFYGVESMEDLKKPEMQAVIREASPISHATKDDPPMYLVYGTPTSDKPLPQFTPIGISIHHANFGRLVKDTYKELGLECQLRCWGSKPERDELEFLKEQLHLKD